MPLIEIIATYAGLAGFSGSSVVSSVWQYLRQNIKIEDMLVRSVDTTFKSTKKGLGERLGCPPPEFDKKCFEAEIKKLMEESGEHVYAALTGSSNTAVEQLFLPALRQSITFPDSCTELETLESELLALSRASIGACLEDLAKDQPKFNVFINEKLASLQSNQAAEFRALTNILQSLIQLSESRTSPKIAPPGGRTDNDEVVPNPFALAKAEDFNHNFESFTRVFQSSPEWTNIQSPPENVFIEGGRGTGKSTLLRNMSAQAVVTERRLLQSAAKFTDTNKAYFGIYVKFTRGYYTPFQSPAVEQTEISDLLGQHELNIEIFASFVNTLRWLIDNDAITIRHDELVLLTQDLAHLFEASSQHTTLEALQSDIVSSEQKAISRYIRYRTFGMESQYNGSATPTVNFLIQLARIFRNRLFPNNPVRLFLLLDEFETLTENQQMALNTVMKMRPPDLTLKIAVRKFGRKTSDTFTTGDPIQEPRDYSTMRIDYAVASPSYSELLRGIAEKRLILAGFHEIDIRKFLVMPSQGEVTEPEIEAQLVKIWTSGKRTKNEMTTDFRQSFRTAAIYRALNEKGKRKQYCGFDDFVLLSSGVVSNFIELCKYAFFFAMNRVNLDLFTNSEIPPPIQSKAVYSVSNRLLNMVEGNVPNVGTNVNRLITDLGAILRQRLLKHSSEPEVNWIHVKDLDQLTLAERELIESVIHEAVTWSVFHQPDQAQRRYGKNITAAPDVDLIFNRIYCPALDISPRSRWRLEVTAVELAGLLDSAKHRTTYRTLATKFAQAKTHGHQGNQAELFTEDTY